MRGISYGVSNESLISMDCNDHVVACIDIVNALQSSGDLSHHSRFNVPFSENLQKSLTSLKEYFKIKGIVLWVSSAALH